MPEEKEYGYARDMTDIDEPGNIPTEVTGNAIDYHLVDHPSESEPGDEPDDGAIKNHDYILLTNSTMSQVHIKHYLDEFDADQRDAVVTASGSIEGSNHQTLPGDPTDPSSK
jgi:hypothetical protein